MSGWRETVVLMARFGLVGLALNVTGYAIYLFATWLGAGPKSTMSVLYVSFAAAGYFAHRRWAFAYRGPVVSSMARYALMHVAGYILNFALLALLSDHLGYPHQAVQALAIVVVTLFLFLASRYFTFASQRHGNA